ncbi:MAG: serine hydrolase domain-containing protein [Asticcacaulis sp.]
MTNTFTRRHFHALITAPLLSFTFPVKASEKHPLSALSADYPGISASVFVKGQQVWSDQSGFADLRTRTPVTGHTGFNIYSTSKALTGMAFARLIAQGRTTLATTAADIDPDLPEHLHTIRIQDILSHTSGIRHYASPQDWLKFAQMTCDTPRDALTYFRDTPLLHPSGSTEHYSSFAFVLASHLLTRLNGEADFASALNQTLGEWAHFELDAVGVKKATPYIQAGLLPTLPEGANPKDIIPSPLPPAGCKFGGGGLIASSDQLAEAGAALASGKIIPKHHLKAALTPWSDVSNVVYGGAIGKITHSGQPTTTYSLSGGAPGGRSYLLVLIEPEISVAICGNIDGPNLADTAQLIARDWSLIN